MKKKRRLLLVALVVGIALAIVPPVLSWSGEAPGLAAGELAPCPDKPNCVCTQTGGVAPIPFAGTSAELAERLARLDGCEVITIQEHYVATEFRTPVLHFVDDVEFLLLPAEGIVHVRSASRIGHSDLGVNAERVELLRKELAERS